MALFQRVEALEAGLKAVQTAIASISGVDPAAFAALQAAVTAVQTEADATKAEADNTAGLVGQPTPAPAPSPAPNSPPAA